jgi:hypothetical protein
LLAVGGGRCNRRWIPPPAVGDGNVARQENVMYLGGRLLGPFGRRFLCLLAAMACVAGCSKTAKKEVRIAETSNLKPLSILYGQYQSKHQNNPPANEADFKKFIQASGQSILAQFDTDLDKLFVSSRDGQPYVVVYRGDPRPQSGVIAYERQGVNGERIVAYPFGAVSVVDENKFRELVPSAS